MEAQRPPVEATVPPYEQWPLAPKRSPEVFKSQAVNAMDLDSPSQSPEQISRTPAVFSMDDLEVAKALTGLREASPAQYNPALASRPQPSQSSQSQNPEPLLALLTSQHPLVATAINQSLSAYTSSKTYSPRFRQGAEFVERNIASPVVSTVGTAGRISGVETGVRWWLQRSDSSGEQQEGRKRQRLESNEMDVEQGAGNDAVAYRSRATSELSQADYLPPYDENRSPVYEEYAVAPSRNDSHPENARALRNWQTRLMMSTSGLGVAMSEESLRSLKYCLSWLRWANNHLNQVLASLQSVLLEWDRSQAQPHSREAQQPMSPVSPSTSTFPNTSNGNNPSQPPPRDEAVITSHLAALKGECVKTLKNALEVVSTYAGGALPDNARALVRRHLTSLPLRFRIASGSNPGSTAHSRNGSSSNGRSGILDPEAQARTPEIVSGAQRVVVLAREGLDMMAQVSGVVDGTIVSAEEWCERLGRKRSDGTANGNRNANRNTNMSMNSDAAGTGGNDKERIDGGGDLRMDI